MICSICGRPAECTHHLIFGRGIRQLADEDGLTIPMCNACHNMHILKTSRIHDNEMAEALSKMLGQSMFETAAVENGSNREQARQQFIDRYGRSYL